MPTTASKVIAEAKSHLNYVEGKGQSTIFGKWFGANGAAWCAMFVSYCLSHAGAPEILKGAQTAKGAAQVSKIKNHLKKTGAKQIKPADAMPGDVVIFDWPGGYETDHVGFIRAKSNAAKKFIYTIEGNTSSGKAGSQSNGGGVYTRTRSFGVVESIWRPKYLPETPAAVTPPPTGEPTPNPSAIQSPTTPPIGAVAAVTPPPTGAVYTDLKVGSKGDRVKKVQARLSITADGIYGPITKKTVEAFQAKKGIVVTGIVTEETWRRLFK